MDEPTNPDNVPATPDGAQPTPDTSTQEAAPFPSTAPPAKKLGRRTRIAIILGAVTLLGAVGLGVRNYVDSTRSAYIPASKPVASADVPEGWSQYREAKSGIAVQMPPGWTSVGIDVLADQAALQAKYPQFAAKLKQLGGSDATRMASGLKFYAESDASQGTFLSQTIWRRRLDG
jgi:hypothetical protein